MRAVRGKIAETEPSARPTDRGRLGCGCLDRLHPVRCRATGRRFSALEPDLSEVKYSVILILHPAQSNRLLDPIDLRETRVLLP